MISSMLLGVAMVASTSLKMDISPWRSINDGVMGGVSAGGMRESREGLKFTGTLSLENNGGFSSVRRMVNRDLSHATKIGRASCMERG